MSDEPPRPHHRNGGYYVADRRQVPTAEIARPATCPRCGQVLQQEPAIAYCRLGCGRAFIVARKRLGAQERHEILSGLRRGAEA